MRLPTFLFVGADKSGSTWLFNVLRQHPDCYVTPAKDVYFFDRYWNRGLEWYASLFADAPPTVRVIGELSHDYLYSEDAARRIAEILPHAKLIVFLRNPVERTFSEYLYLVRSGLARPGMLRETLGANPEPIDHSRYARYLPAYLERFPRSQVGVFLFDDLEHNPAGLARRVYAYLGLAFNPHTDYSSRVLAAARPRNRVVARAIRAAATVMRALGQPTLVGRVKTSRLARILYATYDPAARPRLTDEERAWLHGLLDHDLPALEAMLDRDLSHWRSPQAVDV